MTDSDDETTSGAVPPELPVSGAKRRERMEALAAIEREHKALLGGRTRNLPTLTAKLRSLL